MTREEAKQLLPVIQAYADGAEVQVREPTNIWSDLPHPSFNSAPESYRIKPKPVKGFIGYIAPLSDEPELTARTSHAFTTRKEAEEWGGRALLGIVEIEIPPTS